MKPSHRKGGVILIPIMTINKFQTTGLILASVPKEACIIDSPPMQKPMQPS